MELTDPQLLKKLLSRFRLRPRPELGQHFLINAGVRAEIVSAAALQPGDVVVEIGAGVGTLSQAIAPRCGKLFAYELDSRLLPALRFVLKEFPQARILEQDFLKANLSELFANPAARYKVVANIPYAITGQIIRVLLSARPRPQLAVLLMQSEVAQRIVARPGQMSVLSVVAQFYAAPEIIAFVPRSDFQPPPGVDSAVVKLAMYHRPRFAVAEKDFFRLVKIGFSFRRKTVLNTLSAGYRLPKAEVADLLRSANLDPAQRAQELDLEDWHWLYLVLEKKKV